MEAAPTILSDARRRVAMAVAALALGVSAYTRLGSHSWCREVGSAFDCDKVLASRYAALSGLPLATIGAAGFLLLLFWLGAARRGGARFAAGAGAMAAFAAAAGAALTALSWLRVGAFCVLCSAVHACSLALAVLLVPPAVRAMRARASPAAAAGRGRGALLVALALLAAGAGETYASTRDSLARALARPGGAPHRIDLSDAILIGSPAAPLCAVLFVDFNCPHCRSCYLTVKGIEERTPGRARFYFKHYPLDKQCHPELPYTKHIGSCDAAVAGSASVLAGAGPAAMQEIIVSSQSAFRTFLDALGPRIGVPAERWRALLVGEEARALVQRDIADGRALRIGGVPAAFLDGRWIDSARLEERIRERSR